MPKLIDAEELLEWISREFEDFEEELQRLTYQINVGTFDPTPPVQPDIKCQDKVRYTGDTHKLTRGTVRCVFHDDFGHWADVYDRHGGHVHTVRLDKLEVITDDPST